MYLLGLGLLVLSTWYLMKLYTNFNNDPIAKKEAKGKNPFAPGRIKEALNAYKADMNKKDT